MKNTSKEMEKKNFSLYLDKENKYKILNYDTFFFRSYSVLHSLSIDFIVLGNQCYKHKRL